MRKRHTVIIGFVILFFLSFSVLFTAPKLAIKVQGRWTIGNMGAAQLTGGAGSDFPGTLESTTTEISIDVTKTDNYWEVQISKVDNPWPSIVQIWVRRTSDGSGTPSTIQGGTTYQQVTGTDSPFFSGIGDNTGITVQIKLEGVTVGMNLDDYTSTLSYTATDGYSDWP
ncbi:MAG: hypothetical protein JXJ04_02680 [Spirochaetales bacterium]|nr:hypothetical protein [Spirochaetales bacterium]